MTYRPGAGLGMNVRTCVPSGEKPLAWPSPSGAAGVPLEPYEWTPFTFPFNMTGHPGASVPCGFTKDGLPIGLQIVGRRLADATVLRAAAAFEKIAPWADRKPPID